MATRKFTFTSLLCFAILSLGVGGVQAQDFVQPQVSPEGVWHAIGQETLEQLEGEPWVRPEAYKAFLLDDVEFERTLAAAPLESSVPAALSPTEITLPMPDGSYARFRFVESPIMEPELAAKFPEIRTFLGQGIDDPTASVRFDRTPSGFHAQILSPHGAVYIDPYNRDDDTLHVSYYKIDFMPASDDFCCELRRHAEDLPAAGGGGSILLTGETLRTYRLACAATGEYTSYHGGTVSAGMAAITTTVNRVTGIYETELAIRMVLVANNNLLVYTNSSSDPYTNNDGGAMLSQNQSTIDSVIGSSNYDIGHVFSTGGGGVAYLGVVCLNGWKAGGVTGRGAPIGDAFDVDYVAHEMGHQFGGNHTFNGANGSCSGGNRNASTAYEPGSGSTIMAYAGICGADDLQAHSDPYFHSESFAEIRSYVTGGTGGNCPSTSSTGNSDPTVSAGANYTIPANTPFTLSASGSDPDGDTPTYCWEERDLGPQASLSTPDQGSIPLFRSWSPTTNPSRTFPRLSNLLNNTTPVGEQLPTTSRTMTFRVTARDEQAGGGGEDHDDMNLTIAGGSGPFLVTSPNNPSDVWSGTASVTWNVAGTSGSPVNATSVNILLSTDGGLTFPITLASNTPNDGSETIVVPNAPTTTARVKVEGANNVFFDISNFNFTVDEPGALAIVLPNGAPTVLPPSVPTSFDVQIIELGENLVPGSGTLYYRYDGGTYLESTLAPLGGDLYQATLPAPICGDTPEFLVGAEGDGGTLVFTPGYSAVVGEATTIIDDNFQTNQGWTATNLGASSGDWQRGVPVDDSGWAYDPASDSDGSGQCYLTQNQTGNTDVDGGSVRLTSPTMDMSGGGVTISYDYYLYLTNEDGTDRLLVEIDSNGGSGPWTEIARHDTDGGLSWRSHTIDQTDLDTAGVTMTANMVMRFTANDGDSQSIVEAGLDAFLVTGFSCESGATYTLTVNTTGQGTVDLNPSGGTYSDGEIVTLTANADPGWTFSNWTGDLTGSTNPDTITMDGDKTVTAIFTQDQYTLTINVTGTGTVDAVPDQATYNFGDIVTLTANSDPGWTFSNWTGDLTGSTNPDTITMDGNKTVTAIFTQDQYTLTINVTGTGTVDAVPDQATYNFGDIVTLTANPDPGWTFSNWTGDLTGSTNPDTITMDGNKTVTAVFTQDAYTLTINVTGNGTVDAVPDQATYNFGDIVTLTANPGPGWAFSNWSGDLTGSTNPDTITMNGDQTVTAVFILDCHGDLDYDGDVDLADLAQLLANYGATSGAAYEDGDLDGDGDVDLSDLAELLSVYGAPC